MDLPWESRKAFAGGGLVRRRLEWLIERLGSGRSAFSDEYLDKLSKADQPIAVLKPRDFLDLANKLPPGHRKPRDLGDPEELPALEDLRSGREPLRKPGLLYGDVAEPSLRILGHDGRHRAVSLAESGIEDYPIRLYLQDEAHPRNFEAALDRVLNRLHGLEKVVPEEHSYIARKDTTRELRPPLKTENLGDWLEPGSEKPSLKRWADGGSPRYSSDDEEFPLGDAADVGFTLDDLDSDARRRRARLRAEALATDQKIPVGSAGYEGTSAQDRDPEADLDAAGSIRDLLVPQSPLDLGLMAAMGPGRVPVKAGLGALGMALESSDAEAALGPGMAKRFFSPLVELIRNLDVKKPLPPEAWRQLLEPDPKTGKQARFKDPRTGLEHPVTPDEWEFTRGRAIIDDLGSLGEPISKEALVSELERGYPGLDTDVRGKQPFNRDEWKLIRADGPSNHGLTEYILRPDYGRNVSATRSILARNEAEARDYLAREAETHPHRVQSQDTLPQYSQYTLKGPRTEGSYQESLTKYGVEEPPHYRVVDNETDDAFEETYATREEAIAAAKRFQAEARANGAEDIGEQSFRIEKVDPWDDDVANFIPRASHFGSEPNLLAHSRADRRQTVDGLKARHVDELQSDWHQQARDEGGYREDPAITQQRLKEAQQRRIEAESALNSARANFANQIHGTSYDNGDIPREIADRLLASDPSTVDRNIWDAAQHYRSAMVEYRAAQYARPNDQGSRPPPAPLRKQWHEVELKKQLAQAIEDGDDLLTWTTGDQQIERYKSALRQQVDKIDWVRRPDGKYDITPMKGGRPVNSSSARSKLEGLTDKELEDTIGTEMAKKIRESKGDIADTEALRKEHSELLDLQERGHLNDKGHQRLKYIEKAVTEPDATRGTLQGDDLTVGGAGMRSFYDREVVDTAKKLAKRYGGEYVKTELPNNTHTVDSMFDNPRRVYEEGNGGGRRFEKLHTEAHKIADQAEAEGHELRALDLRETLDELTVLRDEGDYHKFKREMENLRQLLHVSERQALSNLIDPVANHTVHAIKITPQMREKLKATGGKFSLYADGGVVPELPWEEREGFAGGGTARRALIELARKLGVDETSIPALRELEKQMQFHDDLGNKVRTRAATMEEAGRVFHERGELPFAVGTRFTTEKSRELGALPWEVKGHYVDEKNPNRFGYFVERGTPETDDYEKTILFVGDPKGRNQLGAKRWQEIIDGYREFKPLRAVDEEDGMADGGFVLPWKAREQRAHT